jgi:glycosyltransferase involved in cell wall biosynthesis
VSGAVVHVNDVSGVGETLVRGLTATGHDAVLIDPAKRAHGRGGSRLGVAGRRAYFAAERVRLGLRLRWGQSSHLALLHVHYGMFGMIGLLSGAPFVLHFHGGDVIEDDQRILWHGVHVAAARQARRCLVSTPDLLEYAGRLSAPLEFLPNPVETNVSCGGAGGGVLFSAKLDRRKGLDTFLPAAIELTRRGRRVTVLGFGSMAGSAVGLLDELRHSGGNIVTARLSRAAFNELIGRADVVVGQFTVGALGMTELDALARARPVVTRFEYPDAYAAPPPVAAASSAAEIVASVEALMADESLRRSLGESGREWVRGEHDRASVCTRLLKIYEASCSYA